MPLGAAGLGADSLDLLALAGALNQMFHLHQSGTADLLLARRRFGDWVDLIAQAWRSQPEAITFTTSGSTGAPKPCAHRTRDLMEEALEHAQRLRPRRVLAAVPSHHIYGFLFTVLLPALAGIPVADIRAAAPCGMGRGDLLVSHPDHWRFLARSGVRLAGVTGVSSTAPLPAELWPALRAGGLARLVEIYGASETGGVGWREQEDAPFTLLESWAGAAPGSAGALVLRRADGRTAATQDAAVLTGEREFRILQRLDSAVQVGGHNVFPHRVAAILNQHPGVAAASVQLGADGRLEAVLEKRHGAGDEQALQQSVHAWIAFRLAVPERPRAVHILPGAGTSAAAGAAERN
jgi:4-coumarate--CoA ligase (photoactive yellow protein activation family)